MANKLYNEKYMHNIANALRLKSDGISDSFTVAQMSGGVLNAPFANIPSYHYEEAGRVIKRLLELKAAHPNHLLFGAISDNHPDKTNSNSLASARHAAFALEAVGAMAGCDFIANLGDNHVGTNIDTDEGYADALYMENALRYAVTSQLSFNLVGNHEKSNSTQKIYDLIGKYNSFDNHGLIQIRGYGYKDFTDKKVRVIALNTCDYWDAQGGNGMSYEQKDFLMSALDLSAKSDCSEWLIVILSHIPLDYSGGDYNKGADLKKILKAYNEGTTAEIALNSYYASVQGDLIVNLINYSEGALIKDYSGKNTPRIINIHGHIHNNAYGKLKFIDDNTEVDIMRISTPNSAFSQNKTTSYPENGYYSISSAEAAKIAKQAESKKDTSATFYFIDLENHVVYSVGYGADIDRTIAYKAAVIYSVSYNLTDVASGNTSTDVVEGEGFNAILTAENGFAIEGVTVTMGGVNVTSSVYSDGVVNIPTVTGDIVITATAVDNYVPHWDISDRRPVTDMYKGPNDLKTLDRMKYYYGACDTGSVDYRKITACEVNGNDVTFTCTEKNRGIGLPYHLESGASYTFSATASVKARLRVCFHNSDGTFMSGGSYSDSGTDLSLTFTAPVEEGKWVMLILDCYTAGQEVTYTDINLSKN